MLGGNWVQLPARRGAILQVEWLVKPGFVLRHYEQPANGGLRMQIYGSKVVTMLTKNE